MFDKITFNAADTSTWPQLIINGRYYSSLDKPNLTTHGKYGAGLTWVGVDGRDISIYGELGSPKYVNDLGETASGLFVTTEDQEKFWAEGQMSNFTFVDGKGNTSTLTLNWGEPLADGETLPAEENNDEEEPKPIEGGGDDPAELEDGEKPKDGPMENAPTTGRGMETFVKNLNEKMSTAYQKANELESLINKQRDILKKANSFSDDFTARKENIQVISEDIESKRKAEVEELTEKLNTEYSKGVVINERMSDKVLDIDARKAELDSAGAGFAEDSEYKYLKERADRMMLEVDSVKSIRVVDVKVEKKSILEEAKVEKKVIARNPIQTKEEVLEKETGGTISTWTQVEIVEAADKLGPDGQPAFFAGGWEIAQIAQSIGELSELGTKYQMSKISNEGQFDGLMMYFLYSGDMNNIHAETGKGKTTTIGVEWSGTEGILSKSDLAESNQVSIDLSKIKFTEKLIPNFETKEPVTEVEEVYKDKLQTLEDNAGDIFPGEE
jgi:hypothetical protein